jgi:hypothetical protein
VGPQLREHAFAMGCSDGGASAQRDWQPTARTRTAQTRNTHTCLRNYVRTDSRTSVGTFQRCRLPRGPGADALPAVANYTSLRIDVGPRLREPARGYGAWRMAHGDAVVGAGTTRLSHESLAPGRPRAEEFRVGTQLRPHVCTDFRRHVLGCRLLHGPGSRRLTNSGCLNLRTDRRGSATP